MSEKELITKRDIENIRKHISDVVEPLRLIENSIIEMNFKYNDAIKINQALKQIKNSLNMICDTLPHKSNLVDLEKSLREGMKNG